jgi:hypothetical protein
MRRGRWARPDRRNGRMSVARNPEDVTWLGDGHGVAVDLVDGGLTERNEMKASAGRLVIVQRDGAEFVVPGEIHADQALELAQLLMLLASILDPAAVTRTVDNAQHRERLRRMLLEMPPGGAH